MGKDLKGKEIGAGMYQRTNGTYEAKYTDRFNKRKSIYASDLATLKKKYKQAIADDAMSRNVTKGFKLDEWYKVWMETYKVGIIRDSSILTYDIVYKHKISPTLGGMYLKDITQVDVRRLLNRAAKTGVGFETRNKMRILLVDMYDKAIVDDYAFKNPVRGIKIQRSAEEEERRILSVDEQRAFLEAAKGTYYYNFYVVAINSGLRVGELAALTWNDVDFEKKQISVNKTALYQKLKEDEKKEFHIGAPKTKTSRRVVPLTSIAIEALERQQVQQRIIGLKNKHKITDLDKEPVFTTVNYHLICPQNIIDAVKRTVAEANLIRSDIEAIEPFSCHTFRHTFATRCFEAGIDAKTVQAYLGHATLQMTMDLYTHVTEEYSESEMTKLEAIFKEEAE